MGLLMIIVDFFRSIASQRLRTFLTVFGIMWGTATLIILLAFGFGFRVQMEQNMRGMGDNILIMFPGRTTQAFQGYGIGRQIRFRESDADLLQSQVSNIKNISAEYQQNNIQFSNGDRRNTPSISGVNVVYGEMRNVFAQPGGRWINEKDLEQRRRVVFLGDQLKTLLFGEEDAIGRHVMVGNIPFTVIGVMQPKVQNSSYSARDHDKAFMPKSTYATLFGATYVNNIIFDLHDVTLADETKDAVYEVLGRKYSFNSADREAVFVWDTNEFFRFIHYFFLGFNIFLGVIGVFTLAVGGIGVANIMFVVVQERMKEIGIRRAAGARRLTIMGQFFGETFLLVGLGAALGYGIGWVVVKALAYNPIKEFVGVPVFTPEVGLIAFVVLAMIGFASGLMPAWRASRMDIVDCLRS
jgi:putative ABC transport system permease protein